MLGFTRCASTSCFTEAAAYIVGIPVCRDHRDQLRDFHAPKSLIDPGLEPLDIAAVRRLQEEQRSGTRITGRVKLSPQQSAADPDSAMGMGCVYYVTFRQAADRVKIGTTTQAKKRFATLSSQSGCRLRLLVAEPGGRPQENARHRQFDHLRIAGTEYFRYTDELVDHIAQLRSQFPRYRDLTDVRRSYD